jgi:hypothetical protein
MEGLSCAQSFGFDEFEWAENHFGDAELGDQRRTRRLVDLAGAMACNPHMSLPKQLPDWADLNGAYRLLSNMAIAPRQMIEPHFGLTRSLAASHPVVLCVQDDTQLDFTCRSGVTGLGQIGNGSGRGLLQHSSLAILPGKSPQDSSVLGILDLAWHSIQPVAKNEKRRERQNRWVATDVWQEAAQSIGAWPAESMLVHVGDRGADLYRFMNCSRKLDHHFVIRATHDRYVDRPIAGKSDADQSSQTESAMRLWQKMTDQPILGQITVSIGTQRDGNSKIKRKKSEACLSIRTAPVQLPPPVNDPRTSDQPTLDLWAIYLLEENPPQGREPVEWMLLSSLPATTLDQALQLIGYYTCRWKIEEWHRCLKQGCNIEQSQLDHAMDLQRLAVILCVLAVRLLQLRDLADARQQPQPATPSAASDQLRQINSTLQKHVPPMYLLIAAQLAKIKPIELTPQLFLLTIAKRGGYLNRKHDHRPGWLVLWRGWNDIVQMAQGAELYRSLLEQ